MGVISNTPRPGYVWDSADNVWYPIGVGAHQHTNAADTPAVMPYSTYAAAGKNKIINGDCAVNQRNFSSGTAQGQWIVDRFQDDGSGGTITTSVQQFTPGTAPVTGYEAKQYMRTITATQSAAGHYQSFNQGIEDVRTLAGQTATVSFWAKAASGTPNIGVSLSQQFGSGGSSAVISSAAVQTITTSWARYSFTISVPSISGKTIGTSSTLRLYIFVSAGATLSGAGYPAVGLQNNTFDIWGVQVEAGSTATAFQTATGNPASELAACQRYYFRSTNGETYGHHAIGIAKGGTSAMIEVKMPVTMRIKPTSIDYANLAAYDTSGVFPVTFIGFQAGQGTSDVVALNVEFSAGGATAFRAAFLVNNNTTAGYIGLSAEI
jgi:hypothetical protein